MKVRENRNYGWTDLELGSLSDLENYAIRMIGNIRSEVLNEWSLLNPIAVLSFMMSKRLVHSMKRSDSLGQWTNQLPKRIQSGIR